MSTWLIGMSLEDVEREAVLAALRFYHGNRTHTSSALKIAVRTLQTKIARYKEQGYQVPDAPDNKELAQARKVQENETKGH